MAEPDYSDFLKRTGASGGDGSDYAAFLKRTGAVEIPALPIDTHLSDQGGNEYGITGDPQQFNNQKPGLTITLPKTIEEARNMLAPPAGYRNPATILPFDYPVDAAGRDDETRSPQFNLLAPFRGPATALVNLLNTPDELGRAPVGTPMSPENTATLFGLAAGGGLAPSVARGTGIRIAETSDFGAPKSVLYGDMSAPRTAAQGNLLADFPRPTDPPPASIPTMTVRPGEAPAGPSPGMGGPSPNAAGAPPGPRAAGAEATSEPIPEPTPAQKATALQKMVGQSAEDRLTPQGRDDNVYFPGVERPEAMKDFSNAPEGQMSSALQHKALYNTDSHYHDQYDAQVKKNNAIMTDGTTLPDGTRVDGLKDLFGDANTRNAAMDDARELMPGSVHLFDDEKPTDIQPIADEIKRILASGTGKIDGVANTLKKILPKLYDADGKPETLPSQIKGIFDDINNKLYDKSPTIEGNEARQASTQLKQIKAIVSDVIGKGLPGTKWTDYLTNLSGALGKVNKLDYMQQFLTGSKGLWGSDGMLQFNKVNKMLEDIRKHSSDQTGGARQMTMDEINKIEAVRNELAAKDLLDKRAGVRGSPTVQLGTAAGILGSGPLGSAVKTVGEGALHLGLGHFTAGVGNVLLLGAKGIKAGRVASKDAKAANALAATKNRLLDTTPNPLAPP